MATIGAPGVAAAAEGGMPPRTFFGHPRGLAVLFATEFWERFSYYGMRSLLLPFMVATAGAGGLAFSTQRGAAIYGLYTASVYLACLPGGWIADRLIGQRRSVLAGGCVIALGHFSMAIHSQVTFFLGLVLIVTGTGLLKPNVSTMVAELYPEGGSRRDAGFSIFYSGINSGAFVAPLVCGWLGERVDWHVGFAAAGVGMVCGIIQYVWGGRHLGEAGLRPNAGVDPAARRRALLVLLAGLGIGGVLALSVAAGLIHLTPEGVAAGTTWVIVGLAVIYFVFQLVAGGLDATEKKRMMVIFLLFLFAALFWSGFEQAGSSLNLFASDLTDRQLGGWEMPFTILQSINPLFIIVFAPIFAWLWLRLGTRDLTSPTKFALGLIFMALGFTVMVFAARASVGTAIVTKGMAVHRVSPLWLILTYLCHTFGELCLSPVGLSTVTKLAPRRKVSQMMGIWFMSLSLGNLIAGQVAGKFESLPLYQIFGAVALITGLAGVILLLLSRPIRGLMAGVH